MDKNRRVIRRMVYNPLHVVFFIDRWVIYDGVYRGEKSFVGFFYKAIYSSISQCKKDYRDYRFNKPNKLCQTITKIVMDDNTYNVYGTKQMLAHGW